MANFNIVRERKFHDAWAFYLFLLFLAGMNTVFLMNTSNPTIEVQKFLKNYRIIECFVYNLAITVCLLLASFLLCFLIPKVLIIASLLSVPMTSIIFVKNFNFGDDPTQIIKASVSLSICNFIFLCFAAYFVFSKLNYVSLTLRACSKIFFENIFSILSVQITCIFLFAISLVPVLLINSENEILQVLKYSILLLLLWTKDLLFYFMEVFVSSIVFFHIKKDKKGVFINSLTNSIFALGSVAFASLITALIAFLSALARSVKNNRDDKKKSSLNVIVAAIAECLLKCLGKLVEYANSIAFPYLALYGTNYQESLTSSFHLLSNSAYAHTSSSVGLGFVITLFTFLFGSIVFLFNNLILLKFLAIEDDGTYCFILALVFTLFFRIMFSLVQSIAVSLMFSAAACPEELKGYDIRFLEALALDNNKDGASVSNVNEVGPMPIFKWSF